MLPFTLPACAVLSVHITFDSLEHGLPCLQSSDFIEVKTNLQKYILRIILCIKTVVKSNDSQDSGPPALAGLRHGVPVEGPHHLPYLLYQILVFVMRPCNDPLFRFAPHKIAKRVVFRRAGRPDHLLQHLCNVT